MDENEKRGYEAKFERLQAEVRELKEQNAALKGQLTDESRWRRAMYILAGGRSDYEG